MDNERVVPGVSDRTSHVKKSRVELERVHWESRQGLGDEVLILGGMGAKHGKKEEGSDAKHSIA